MHPVRKWLRLTSYDYRAGWFFVTVCSACKIPVFGVVRATGIASSPVGELTARCWHELPSLFAGVGVDSFALMPDHLHGIIALTTQGVESRSTEQTPARTLSSIIGAFKSRVSRLARAEGLLGAEALWQRAFHERVIRDERELAAFRTISGRTRWR